MRTFSWTVANCQLLLYCRRFYSLNLRYKVNVFARAHRTRSVQASEPMQSQYDRQFHSKLERLVLSLFGVFLTSSRQHIDTIAMTHSHLDAMTEKTRDISLLRGVSLFLSLIPLSSLHSFEYRHRHRFRFTRKQNTVFCSINSVQ